MLAVYGALTPLRILEEIRFWKRQEKEHTIVIRKIAPNLEPVYVKVLEEWETVFAQTELEAHQLLEAALHSPEGITPAIRIHTERLALASDQQSRLFIRQLTYIQQNSAAIQANPTAQAVIAHIIRESEYFLCALQSSTRNLPFMDRRISASISSEYRSLGSSGLTATGEGTWSAALAADAEPVPIGGHTLPPLPYSYDALEPYIDTETVRLHHDKHHQAYVDGLNKAETELAKARETGDFALVKHWEREAAFHGAGHYLHTILWNVMTPKGGGEPADPLLSQLQHDFGSFIRFRKHFSQAAEKVEGNGWALLVWSPRSHRLEILQAEKHQNLTQWDVIPLLVLDVWEHSYYLKYRNNRAKYIDAWWNVVNWKHVNERFKAARTIKWQPF